MRLEGEYIFQGKRELVWEVIRDPAVLAQALPGTQSLDRAEENVYECEMKVRVGPVSGTFGGRITIADEVPPERYTLVVEGRGKAGFLKGSGDILLTDQGDGTTHMKYLGEVQIGGRVASVGQRLFDSASKSMIRQGLEALNAAVTSRAAGS